MPRPIIEIDELVRLVIGHLVEISPRSAVSFALTCRSLEEPVLSSLWRRQDSVYTLLRVLPQFTKVMYWRRLYSAIVGDPTPKEWDRLRRFASWMRRLELSGDYIAGDTLSRLSRELPGGVLCPKLERLVWDINLELFTPIFQIFLSPSLKRVSLDIHLAPTRRQLQHAAEIISHLPTSLEHLTIVCGPWCEEIASLEDTISSLVLQLGPLFRSLGPCPLLSETAFHHVTQLPNLCFLAISHPPPQTFSLPTFPSLGELYLEHKALPWLHLLAACGEEKHQNGPTSSQTIMNTNVKETLGFLTCPSETAVHLALLSSISSFRNLVSVRVANSNCHSNCLFDLTDDDVENFAATLPSLVDLQLGEVCHSITRRTTVSSLLSVSTRCLGLTRLEIHFNTNHIVEDMKRLLDEGSGRGKPRCKLQDLLVGYLPLKAPEFAEETLAMGFADIFPCLERFSSYGDDWKAWDRVEKLTRS